MKRRDLIAGTLAGLGAAAVASPARATGRDHHFRVKAALLDPACVFFENGANREWEVPFDRTWYLLNAWAVRWPDDPFLNFKWHKRDWEPLALPPGTRIKTNDFGYLYWADPSLLWTDPAYDDPETLYYDRLAQLDNIPLERVSVHFPRGQADSVWKSAPFPLDADKVLIRHVDCHDGCWTTLTKGPGVAQAMNLQSELDDKRPMRFTTTMMGPIRMDLHDHLRIGLGHLNTPGIQECDGWGTVMFQRVPW